MKKQMSKEELREENKRLIREVKKVLNCEKVLCGWVRELEEKCSDRNKLGTEGQHLIIDQKYWVLRDYYLDSGEIEVFKYYYFTEKPGKKQIEYMERLSDIHDNLWLSEDFESFRKIQRLKAEVFGEMSLELNFEEEMSEEAKREFEAKKKLVNEGKSYLFKEEFEGISKEEFVQGLKWIESDPLVEVNGEARVSRAIGRSKDGKIMYGEVHYFNGFRKIYPLDLSLSSCDFPSIVVTKLSEIY